MKPSVGRIVHYVSYGTPGGEYSRECRAAIVTEVTPDGPRQGEPANYDAGLCVLNPTGQFFNRGVHYRPVSDAGDIPASGTSMCGGFDYPGGTWHWPVRIEAHQERNPS